jgi:hypothetical protein
VTETPDDSAREWVLPTIFPKPLSLNQVLRIRNVYARRDVWEGWKTAVWVALHNARVPQRTAPDGIERCSLVLHYVPADTRGAQLDEDNVIGGSYKPAQDALKRHQVIWDDNRARLSLIPPVVHDPDPEAALRVWFVLTDLTDPAHPIPAPRQRPPRPTRARRAATATSARIIRSPKGSPPV